MRRVGVLVFNVFIQNQFNRPKINIYTVEFGKIEQWKIPKNCIFIQKAMLFTCIYQKKKKCTVAYVKSSKKTLHGKVKIEQHEPH
jgi:hypothetical protein